MNSDIGNSFYKFAYFILLCILFSVLFTFIGCGSSTDNEYTTFQNNMNTFYENISQKSAQIDAINPEDEDSDEQLLALLDSINEDFKWLDSISVPSSFQGIDQFANEGMQYMQAAVDLYHSAFEGDSNYENILVAAKENYRRANLRISYINDILQGNEPAIETTQ